VDLNIVGGTHNIYPFKKYTKPEFITKMSQHPPHPQPSQPPQHPTQHASKENCSECRTCSTQNELSTTCNDEIKFLFTLKNLTYHFTQKFTCELEVTYTECPRRNGQNFGRVFLMLNYTNITQNTYIQS